MAIAKYQIFFANVHKRSNGVLAPFQMIGPAVLGCQLLPQKPA
jgi:hypothetical protein